MFVSLIIPTIVERKNELVRLLSSVASQKKIPDEVIIVMQGFGNNYVSAVASIQQSFPMLTFVCIQSSIRSLTKARNEGVCKSRGDIIAFSDDDIILEPNYIEKMIHFFETYPKALGVQGLITDFVEGHTKKIGGNSFVYACYNVFAKIFLLNNSSTKNKLLLSGRSQYATHVKTVTPCEWLSGIGAYRKSVFTEFTFDESLGGYALGEDKLFSYPIYKTYPGTLYIDPSIRCRHMYGKEGRPENEELVRMKVQNIHYIWNRLMSDHGFPAKIAFWWANIGDLISVFFASILRVYSFRFFLLHVRAYFALIGHTYDT